MSVRPMTRAGDFLKLSARRYPNRACFVFEDGTQQTFAETNSRVNQLATALQGRGIQKGDRIAIVSTDCGEYVELLLACMKIGATYVPLNNRLAEDEVRTLLDRAAPAALFLADRYLDLGLHASHGIESIRHRVAFTGASPHPQALPFADLLAEGSDVEPDVEISDDDILGLAFTSGTTGLPKGVLQPQRMIKTLVTNMSIDYEVQPDEFRYTASPIFHIAGQGMLFMHVWRGASSLILPQFDADKVLDWMHSGRLTGLFLVPTMISMIVEHPRLNAGDFSSIGSIIYGGAPITPALLRRAIDGIGCGFINAFGAATEGGLQTVLSSADHRRAAADSPHLLGSIGKAAYGVEVRIVDESGNDVPIGEVGEIISRSDAVMAGYLEMPDKTAESLRDGWFAGGDLGRVDADGYYYIEGRRTDMIIRGGENIYPAEIETIISAIDGISQVAVVGQPDDHWGETVVAFVTLTEANAVSDHDIRQRCRAALATYKVPERVVILQEFPMNASGKILKRQLRAGQYR
ncbi:class I adenylate-forming enzyme family protein [Cumulibacter soli]|uniref:class I adenylate-forming enzyme family protein n=1 Tax=Cumulibacter soli TaxID=2546344 RepID=UPI00106867C4|nr:AMP-binding protein [Cumulibacter soli]